MQYFSTMFVCLHSFKLGSIFSAPCAAQVILWRFRSNRSDHLKVPNIVKKTKSGSGASPQLTAKQLFKLNRYAFLDAYQRSRSTSSTMGQVKHTNTPIFSPSEATHLQFMFTISAHIILIFHLIACPQMPGQLM